MFCNKDDARNVFNEVMRTHSAKMGYDKQTGDIDFDAAFTHFDVNNDGLIEVERMPQFLRYTVPNGALDNDLQ